MRFHSHILSDPTITVQQRITLALYANASHASLSNMSEVCCSFGIAWLLPVYPSIHLSMFYRHSAYIGRTKKKKEGNRAYKFKSIATCASISAIRRGITFDWVASEPIHLYCATACTVLVPISLYLHAAFYAKCLSIPNGI